MSLHGALYSIPFNLIRNITTFRKQEDLRVLKRSPDLLNNFNVSQGQLRLIIQTYFVLLYMGMVAILVKWPKHIYIYDLHLNKYRKMNISRFFQYKCIRNQIWPCCKKGQGQLCAYLIAHTSLMLHSKSQRQWPFRSREDDISRFFFYLIWAWQPS